MKVASNAARWQREKEILADALEIRDPTTRTAFLAQACHGDAELQAEIAILLSQSAEDIEECVEFGRGASESLHLGRRLGTWRILREIGRGGMGAVYLAERADGEFEKQVAIKLLKRGTDTDEVLRRFRAERRTLARLDHPNIARLLDAGTTEDGLPFLVMEYVRGEAITEYVHLRHLSISDRLALFLKVCSAVQAAHESNVIHRDLKPGNILVRPDGEPKLLDFGIAKLLDAPDEAVFVTITQQRRLTPACASPEQARGEAVTQATDVYALGALLYELLTDVSPHRFSSAHPSSEEIARVVCQVEATRPSTIRRELRGDLDTIVLTALRKEPTRRYAAVAILAEDIRRHLAGRPILARKNSPGYVARRFVRRNKIIIATAVAMISLIAAVVIMRSTANRAQSLATPTKDLVAYDLFLRGQALMNDIATSADWEGDNRRAADLFDRAVTHDPTFALAYTQLCRAEVNLYMWVDHTQARLAQAKKAVQEAERLAPESPDTYVAEGQLADAVGDDRRAFERFSLAHRNRPDDAVILSRLAQSEEVLGKWDQALRDMEHAKQLAPNNSNIPNYLIHMYAARRDYDGSDRVCDDAIARFPNGPNYYRVQKVENAIDRGDTQQASVRLAEIPEKFDPSGVRSLLRLEISLIAHDYERLSRDYASLPRDHFIADFQVDADFLRAVLADQKGDRATIESLLLADREKIAREGLDVLHTTLGAAVKRTATLARIDSFLGRNDDALRESEEAIAAPLSRMGRPPQELIRAEVLMRAGQNGRALDLLERIATVPYGPSYGDLLNPCWDRLRGDARFGQIVQQLAASARNR